MTLIVENVGSLYKLSPICFGRDLLKCIYQHFKRKKCNKITRNVLINDIKLFKKENMPRSFWPLARIIHVHVGNYRIVRSCKIKLGNNYYYSHVKNCAYLRRLIKQTYHSDIESSLAREDVALDERNYKRMFLVHMNKTVF